MRKRFIRGLWRAGDPDASAGGTGVRRAGKQQGERALRNARKQPCDHLDRSARRGERHGSPRTAAAIVFHPIL
ncbi:MAG: hypothetical protein AB7S42_05365, partial [Lysobacteraceae bacterium]